MASTPDYPFTPRSNRYLRPGQYWAIPLSDDRFGCGGFKAIANTGGDVLGLRPLELDGLQAEIPGYEVGAVHRVWGLADDCEPRGRPPGAQRIG